MSNIAGNVGGRISGRRMVMSKADKNDERTQRQKFRDLAREAECDDDELAFDRKLKKIAEAETPKEEKKNPAK